MIIKTRKDFPDKYFAKNKCLGLLFATLLSATMQLSFTTTTGHTQNIHQTSLQEPGKTRILFLLDGSLSMIGRWESGTKYQVARKLLSDLVDSLQNVDNLEMGLRVYGHMKKYPPQDCDDTRLEVPLASGNALSIKRKLDEIRPSGTTPIALSLEQCASDFPTGPGRNIIIIITDGIEECQGDPCAVSLVLQKRGIILKPFVIGMGINKEFVKSFECVGTYYDAVDEKSFKTAFDIVISQALHNTTIQVNLLDAYHRPTESNVNMTFYDRFSGNIRYNFIHTMNHRGLPDTLAIDPSEKYRIVVHTIPPVELDSAVALPGKHNIFAIDAPQGDLTLSFEGGTAYRGLKCIVRQAGSEKTLHVQDFNSTERYLTGNYDLEVLCLPRMLVYDVNISQSKTTTVQVPKPGLITILRNSPGHGSIYVNRDNKLEWVVNLEKDKVKETFVLQPGNYVVVYRALSSREAEYSIEKSFSVTSGASKSLKLN